MADQSRPIKNAAFDLYFHLFVAGVAIANPGGLAGRIVCAAHTAGAATDNAPTVVDTTGGGCKLTLTAAEMNGDFVEVKVTSTDAGAQAYTIALYPTAVAMTGDAFAAVGTAQTMLTDIHGTDLPAVKADTAAILMDTGTTLEARQVIIERLLRNRFDTDPATGIATLYADDGTTPLYTADVYEDVAGTMPFDGSGANRRDRLA